MVDEKSSIAQRPQESLYRNGRVRPSDRGRLIEESKTLSASIRVLRFLNNSIPALCPKDQKCMKNIVDGEQSDSLEKKYNPYKEKKLTWL